MSKKKKRKKKENSNRRQATKRNWSVSVFGSAAAPEIYSSNVVDRRMRDCQTVGLSVCLSVYRSVGRLVARLYSGKLERTFPYTYTYTHTHTWRQRNAHQQPTTANNSQHCAAPLSTPHAPLTNITNTPRLLWQRCTTFGSLFVFAFAFEWNLQRLHFAVFLIWVFFSIFFYHFFRLVRKMARVTAQMYAMLK